MGQWDIQDRFILEPWFFLRNGTSDDSNRCSSSLFANLEARMDPDEIDTAALPALSCEPDSRVLAWLTGGDTESIPYQLALILRQQTRRHTVHDILTAYEDAEVDDRGFFKFAAFVQHFHRQENRPLVAST